MRKRRFVKSKRRFFTQIVHPRLDARGIASRELEELALEIARDENVHRGRGREHEGPIADVIDARLDEVGEHAVGVTRADDAIDGYANLLGVPAREDVAEVSGGNGHVNGVTCLHGAIFDHDRIRADIVHDLRQQPAPVDRVRRGERDVLVGSRWSLKAASSNMRLTLVWQSSKLPRTP